jgi:hypothetical protein
MTATDVNTLFKKAMQTLHNVELELSRTAKQNFQDAQQTAETGQVDSYQLQSLNSQILSSEIRDGYWANRVMMNVRRSMVAYNDQSQTIFQIHRSALPLSRETFETLIAAMGLLYPICFEKTLHTYSLNAVERQIVQKAATNVLALK